MNQRYARDRQNTSSSGGTTSVIPAMRTLASVHAATLLAMGRAVRGLEVVPDTVLVDGLFVPNVCFPCTAIVSGDATIHQIMAASIIAKTTRDRWMERYARVEPLYGFDRHKGYATAEHLDAVARYGYSDVHRRSFRPMTLFDANGEPAV